MIVATNIERDRSMNQITTIGLDLAEKIFQVHGIDADGRAVVLTTILVRRGRTPGSHRRIRSCCLGGGDGSRTHDLLDATEAL